MHSELICNNSNLIVTWESSTTILEVFYDQSGKFTSIKKEVWKDLNFNFNIS